MHKTATTKRYNKLRRHKRVRKAVNGTEQRPRLTVFKTSRHIYAQIVVDPPLGTSRTLFGVSTRSSEFPRPSASEKGKMHIAKALGGFLAEKATSKGIKKVVFDRSGYPYHGRVKALAEGAREKGLEF